MSLSMFSFASIAVLLSLLLISTLTEDQPTFTEDDLATLDATVQAAKAKLSSDYYFLDDPSPGDYFDNITMATKMFIKVGKWNDKREPFVSLFKEMSSKMEEQAAPFGKRECSLLPKEFRPCTIEPKTGGTISILTSKMDVRITYFSWPITATDLIGDIRSFCKTLDTSLKTSEALLGDKCEESVGDEDSEEQAIKQAMFRYAKGNGFEGNESNCLHLFIARYTRSAQAVQKFKLSFDKHFLAWVTMQAFCMVVIPAPSEDAYRARVMEMHASFSRSLSRTRDIQGFSTDNMRSKYFHITGGMNEMFKDALSKTDDQAAPLGLRECWLLPEQLRNYIIAPIIGLPLNALTASVSYGRALYSYDTLRTACATFDVDDTLQTMEALIGENCDKGVARNGSVEEAVQEDMMQYARENNFTGVEDENRCLHVFVARYKKSEEAVTKFMMSFDKYYLASVTIQAFCTVFTPKCNKEAQRARLLKTHSSFAKGFTRLNTSQLDNNKPWTCDTRPEELIANASAACDEIKSTIGSTTYFLGNQSAEEYVNMTFEMVDAVRGVDKDTFARLQDASTPREQEVWKKTRSSVLSLMADLMEYLVQAQRQLPKPFGRKKDVLWPERVYFKEPYPPLSDVFQLFGMTIARARGATDAGKNYAIDGRVHRRCENSETEKILKRTMEPMKGGCETHVDQGPDKEDEELAPELMTYAMAHGFDGCEDNKCLQIFIARYIDPESYAIETLKNSVDNYTLLSVIMQSICASSVEDAVLRENMRMKTVNVVGSVKKAMSVLGNLSSKADIYKPCAASFPAWASEVETIATKVVDKATNSINASSWQARQSVNELAAKGIVDKLNGSTYKDGYFFKALAYLPFGDYGQHGFLSVPIGAEDVVRNESKLVKYVVSRYRKRAGRSPTILREKWNAIEKEGRQILDATFSTSASNLSKRVEEVAKRFEKDIGGTFLSADGFRAIAALRCGYEFVWYELGYRYFPAGFATDGFALVTEQDNKYKYNCGQIVFFP